MVDPLIAQAQGNFKTGDAQLVANTAQYQDRLRALQAQQQAAARAEVAAQARTGQTIARGYSAATAGGARDLAGNGAGGFAGQLQQANQVNAQRIGGQNARDALYQQSVAAANNQGWNDRIAGANSITAQGRQSLYTQLVDQQNQIAQAEADAAASGGGGGGGGGGHGGGRGGSSGRPSLGFLGAAFDAENGDNSLMSALERSRGTRGGLNVIRGIIGNHSPDSAARLYQTAVDRWNYNKAHHTSNGVSLTNLKRVLGYYKSSGSVNRYDSWRYNQAKNSFKYG